MGRGRPIAVLLASLAGVVLVGASLAYACSPQYTISIRPGSGPAGVPVNVSGVGFKEGVVEIRWQSGSGALLGTVAGARSFSTSVTVPEASPGVHYVVAQTADGAFASAPFEVVAPRPAVTAPPVEVSPTPPVVEAPAPIPAPAPPAPERPAPAVTTAPAPSLAPRPAVREAVPAPSVLGPAPVTAPTADQPKAQPPAAVPADAALNPAPSAEAAPLEPAPPGDAVVPSVRAVTGDAWSGFRGGALGDAERPAQPSRSDGSGPSAMGVVLLAVGTALVAAGTGVGLSRRRRALPTQLSDR